MKIKVANSAGGLPDYFGVASNDGVFGAFDNKTDIQAHGFTIGETAAVPEPADGALVGFGLLAVGAAGVRELRRRKAAVLAN